MTSTTTTTTSSSTTMSSQSSHFHSLSVTSPSSSHTIDPSILRRPIDSFSNVSNFSIIDSTLREGEQFSGAHFNTDTKIAIAKALDQFGVEYIEVTSPAASPQSKADCETICKLGLRAKIVAHIRCHIDDAKIAADAGVDGLNVVIGTSALLRQYSHGKDMSTILSQATQVVQYIQSRGLEVRFSSEDAFRSDLVDLITLYRHMDQLGIHRVGIADTVGCADPRQVYEVIRLLRGIVHCDIEVHMHNDTGCAIANAFTALEAGATHVDTCILGIGERNGITPLGGLIARVYTASKQYIINKYELHHLYHLDQLVAKAVGIQVPFNNYITGSCAFIHKAGIHSKAVLNNPATYEVLNPDDFGVRRTVAIGHRLTGWNSIKARVKSLSLSSLIDDKGCKLITAKIKCIADRDGPLDLLAVDQLIYTYSNDPDSFDSLQVNSFTKNGTSTDTTNQVLSPVPLESSVNGCITTTALPPSVV